MLDGTIDFTPFFRAIDRAFTRLVAHFEEAQIEEMTTEKWAWYRETIRGNGTIAGFIRDIVDQGSLKDSLRIYRDGVNAVSYFYEEDYAALVHQGGKTSTGADYPDRPWVDEAIENNDLLEIFAMFLKEEIENA